MVREGFNSFEELGHVKIILVDFEPVANPRAAVAATTSSEMLEDIGDGLFGLANGQDLELHETAVGHGHVVQFGDVAVLRNDRAAGSVHVYVVGDFAGALAPFHEERHQFLSPFGTSISHQSVVRLKQHCLLPPRLVANEIGHYHLRVQTVDATSSFNASNGDTQLRVLRGRSLSSRSTAVSSR